MEDEKQREPQQWITEGIPFAFRDHPLLYEEIREFIARGVRVHTKEVTLVGSGRIGYSLKKQVWGRAFLPSSDLDFTVISNDLYKRLVSDFQKWVEDIHIKKLRPHSVSQSNDWLASIATVDRNIPRGFINTKNLLSHDNYPNVKNCYHTMRELQERLKCTDKAPKIADISVRVYSSWKACISQLRLNFKIALGL